MKMQFDFCPLLSVAFICAMLSPLISKALRHKQNQKWIHFMCRGWEWSSWKVCCLTIPSTDCDGPCACVGCMTKGVQCTAEKQSRVCQNSFSPPLAQWTEFTPCNSTEDKRLQCYKYLKHLNTYYTYYINIKLGGKKGNSNFKNINKLTQTKREIFDIKIKLLRKH